jgi:thiol-disulfide isomerase/thioredoxin
MPQKRLLPFAKWLFIIGISLLTILECLASAIEEGKPAPPLTAKLLDGTSFTLAQAKGNVVIINFWATWCAPCRAELPALDEFYRRHHRQGLTFLAISVDDADNEVIVRKVMQAFSFPAALLRNANVKDYGRIWRVPLTFVVDRDGILRKDSWYEKNGINAVMLEKTVTPLLQSPAKK